jgi:uncharacterized membrane protein YgcG
MRGIMPTKSYTWVAFLLALTWSTGAAPVAKADVRDGAGFFKAETISKANTMIEQMRKKYHKDLIVDTLATAPKDKENEAASKDEEVKSRFHTDFAAERAGSIGDNGIYLLITKSPLYFQVQASSQTLKKAFTTTDIRNLRSLLADEFNKKNFDEGLIECVEYVQRRLDSATRPITNVGAASPPPGGKVVNPAPESDKTKANSEMITDNTWFRIGGVGLVIVLGIWLVASRMRVPRTR